MAGLLPDAWLPSVKRINPFWLTSRGVKHLVFDVDHTIAVNHASEVEEAVRDYIAYLVEAAGIESVWLATNSKRDLSAMALSLNATLHQPVRWSQKPLGSYFGKIEQLTKAEPGELVMVGDRMINDIWGANRRGWHTILVDPLGHDAWFDKLLLRRWRHKLINEHWQRTRY